MKLNSRIIHDHGIVIVESVPIYQLKTVVIIMNGCVHRVIIVRNPRVTLTLQLSSISRHSTYAIVSMLIDKDRI
jgi:hypothetical protein